MKSLDKTLDFYRRLLGMKAVADPEASTARDSLLLPPGRRTRVVTLRKEGAGPGFADLRLLEIGGKLDPIREGASPWDWAVFELGFAVDQVDQARLQMQGAGFLCKAVAKYSSSPNPGTVVQETLCRGPQDEGVGLLQTAGISGAQGVTQAAISVRDATAVLPFYEALGLKKRRDMTYDHDGVRELVSLPTGGKLRVVTLESDASPATRLLLLEFFDGGGWRLLGRSLAERARPPRHGIYLLTFEVPNLDAAIAGCLRNGGRLQAPPSGVPRSAAISTSDGVLIELMEHR